MISNTTKEQGKEFTRQNPEQLCMATNPVLAFIFEA